ncbi:Transmembrane protease serine 9 [Paragonimus heterotremus]|uniref:Transmembrane protease serine 9 n=1 Tax=Paragonimus heterotremus TaxID=100268 RepID=A0A8J4WHH4_9TREM|nr:Transmembrane protease serine 9 [Paragonimus heterotremus]
MPCLFYFLRYLCESPVYIVSIVKHIIFIRHSGLLEYDIALMKIKGNIPYLWRKSIPASLPLSKQVRQWPLGGTKCTFVGWGCTRAGDAVTDIASVAKLKALHGRTCDKFFNDVNHGHEFCAGYHKSGLGTCPGDSGSGLVCKHHGSMTVVGVLSGSDAAQPQNFPSIYVRVAKFIDWIQMEMKQN